MYKCIEILRLYSIIALGLTTVFMSAYLLLFIYSTIKKMVIKLRDTLFKKVKNK